MKIAGLVRVILTLGLIYGAYTETGIFTALSLGLIGLSIEVNAKILKDKGIVDSQVKNVERRIWHAASHPRV